MASPVNILLVEDNDDDALLFETSVKKLPVRVTHVSNPAKAILRLSGSDPLPDLIVLDPTLPGASSDKFLKWVKSDPAVQKIPICIYTGASMIASSLKNAVRGAFYKSANTAEIRETVHQMCAFVD